MTHEHEQDEVPSGVLDGEGAPAGDYNPSADDASGFDEPADEPDVDAPADEPADEPDVDAPADEPDVDAPADEPADEPDVPVDTPAPLTRASRRAKRRRTPILPVLAVLTVLTALAFGGYQTFTAVTDLSLGQQTARGVLAGQTVALLLLAIAGITAVLLADRRAALAAKNPTVEALQAELVAAERNTAKVAESRDAAVAATEDLRTRLGQEEARVAASAAAVRTADAVRDQARADLQRYLDNQPPSADQIRQQVAEEISAAQQSALADLHQAHERVVGSLRKRIMDAENAADRAREAAATAEASVAAERDKTRAEERTRMRITVQALAEADVHAVHGEEGAAAVAEFASRFVAAVERLSPETATTPPRPVRALASSRDTKTSDESSKKATKKRRGWLKA